MADEIIEELWRAKDAVARRHGYDMRRLGEYLRSVSGRTTSDVLEELRRKAADDEAGKALDPERVSSP